MQGFSIFFVPLIFISVFGYTNLGKIGGTILTTIYILLVLIQYLIRSYNSLKRENIKITEARSNINIYLQQRFEEITAIYKVVQEFKAHELETFREIVQLRQMLLNKDLNFKDKITIHNAIETRIPTALANFEDYPELHSNENFLQLQESISENEDNIGAARRAYNGYVNKYNTSISMFPDVFLAKLFRFKSEDLYTAPAEKLGDPLL